MTNAKLYKLAKGKVKEYHKKEYLVKEYLVQPPVPRAVTLVTEHVGASCTKGCNTSKGTRRSELYQRLHCRGNAPGQVYIHYVPVYLKKCANIKMQSERIDQLKFYFKSRRVSHWNTPCCWQCIEESHTQPHVT